MSAAIGKLSKVAILGSGQMGTGIAQVIVHKAKLPVYLYDLNSAALKSGISSIDSRLLKEVERGKLTLDEYRLSLSRIQLISQLEHVTDADIIIEAIKEDSGEKIALFKQLSSLLNQDTVLASNTSSISITKLASVVVNPSRV